MNPAIYSLIGVIVAASLAAWATIWRFRSKGPDMVTAVNTSWQTLNESLAGRLLVVEQQLAVMQEELVAVRSELNEYRRIHGPLPGPTPLPPPPRKR